MRFGVLGETAVWTEDGRPVRVPELKVRALLASLLVDTGRPVATHRLVDDLWGEEPPGNPLRALQAKVSQLRRVLEEAEPGGRDLLVSRAPGYQLTLAEGALDTERFAALAARARAVSDPVRRVALFAEALEVWRGPAFADFADEPFTRAAVNRLEEEWLVVHEDAAEARLAAGEHALLVGELAELVERHPLRERLRAVQLRALYRSGRQSEALAGYEELRVRLAEDLGLDPSPELVELQRAMLRQDPALDAVRGEASVAGGGAGGGRRPVEGAASTRNGDVRDPASLSPSGSVPSGDESSGAGVEVPAQGPGAVRGEARGNLPVAISGLVGREEAVEEIRELLAGRRLVTLTGPGGVGKTRLAVEAAGQAWELFPDGAWLVELAGAHGELAEVVAAAMELRDDGAWGIRPEAGRTPGGAERLAAVLRGKRMLLVLDNCEHVIDEAAALTELLLRTVPDLVVLTTSQEPLALAGETLWSVPPLDLAGAVELFVARAAASAPGFVPDASQRAAVEGICRRLDGVPLALELAATRVRALGVHRLLERLDDRFRLLSAGQRGAPARQQTLRAVIDWSWELLPEPERLVLRRLAVHAEGCTLDAAEQVCGGGEVAPDDVLDLLARLVDRSLVVVVDGKDGPRYRLLESVAAYCLERMADAGETEDVRGRHLTYYTSLAEAAEPELRGYAQREWMTRLDAESPNLRAALDRAVQRGDAEHALRLVDALAWYWVLRGRLGEAVRSTATALDTVDSPDLASGPDALARVRARVAVWRTGLTVMSGDGTDRRRRIASALASVDAAYGAGPAALAWARWFLAHALCGTGSQSEGEELTNAALDGFAEAGESWGEAAALGDRSVQRLLRGDLAGAEDDAARSAALFAAVGDACGGLWSVYPLATVAEIRGEYERAAGLKRAALDTAQSFGLTTEVPDLLSGLGRTALLMGDLAQARAYHQAGREKAVEVGFRAGEINAVLGLGLGARREGLLEEAEGHLREVLDWHRLVGLDGANALILAELGFAAELRGDAEGALALHEEGYATALTTGDPRAVALALEGLAGAHALVGRGDGAALLLGAAGALRASTGAPLPAAERGDVERVEAVVRAALGDGGFLAAQARGEGLGAEAAVGEARGVSGAPVP
ncbi:AfsR/SARP family transcriptional regulator [Streptomyces sp. NBC_01353]|uniref:AfsR/SARP family transcriptional regulator n=1 Tax=Streptomyces sp. NBC_01353 TaxID=2903835 RepID=UPI002E3071F2|nr:BTAD domain-containing putative transcriptional regulator [Streptomyces sp. NBC_01353]